MPRDIFIFYLFSSTSIPVFLVRHILVWICNCLESGVFVHIQALILKRILYQVEILTMLLLCYYAERIYVHIIHIFLNVCVWRGWSRRLKRLIRTVTVSWTSKRFINFSTSWMSICHVGRSNKCFRSECEATSTHLLLNPGQHSISNRH